MPKYVASRSLDDVAWNASLLGPDIVTALQDLKAQPGKDLIKYGTSLVTRARDQRRAMGRPPGATRVDVGEMRSQPANCGDSCS